MNTQAKENRELFLALIDVLKVARKDSKLIWKAEELLDGFLDAEVQSLRNERAEEQKRKAEQS